MNEQKPLERFIIVLNCSEYEQVVKIPFSANGKWDDLLNGDSFTVEDFWIGGEHISSH